MKLAELQLSISSSASKEIITCQVSILMQLKG